MGGPAIYVVPQGRLAYTSYVASDITINNSTTFINATGLVFPIPANSLWSITFVPVFQTNSTANIKFKWLLPSGSGGHWGHTSTAGVPTVPSTTAELVLAATTGVDELTLLRGYLPIGSTGGVAQLQLAQDVADVSDTKLLMGSFLIVQPLG